MYTKYSRYVVHVCLCSERVLFKSLDKHHIIWLDSTVEIMQLRKRTNTLESRRNQHDGKQRIVYCPEGNFFKLHYNL